MGENVSAKVENLKLVLDLKEIKIWFLKANPGDSIHDRDFYFPLREILSVGDILIINNKEMTKVRCVTYASSEGVNANMLVH